MHFSLVACGLSALISPHDGHTATVCEVETSRLSTVVGHWSKVLAAKNTRHSPSGCQRRRTPRVSMWDNTDSQSEQVKRTVCSSNPSTQIDLISFDCSETAITTVCSVIWYGQVGQGGACGQSSTSKHYADGAGFSIGPRPNRPSRNGTLALPSCDPIQEGSRIATGRGAALAQLPTAR